MTSKKGWARGLLLGLLLAGPQVRAQGPVGNDFQVNTYTTSFQSNPSVGVSMDGSFVISWQSNGASSGDTNYYSVQAQRFHSTGLVNGTQFQVNSYTTENQRYPSVGVGADGSFVVSWQSVGSFGNDSSAYSIQAQRFHSTGLANGTQFQVNSYTTGQQRFPSVGMGTDGSFVVSWESPGIDGSGYGIEAQRFHSTGLANGTQLQVNSYTTGNQRFPSLGVTPGGSFVVSWQSSSSSGDDNSGDSIQARRFESNGMAVAPDFQVNSYTTGRQSASSVGVAPDGSFAVSWQSNGSSGDDGSGSSIQAQKYHSNGGTDGPELQVNTFTSNNQAAPSVGVTPGGSFVVSWQSVGSPDTDTSLSSIQARRYQSNGMASGTQFQVNSYTNNDQVQPALAILPNSDFLTVWRSDLNGSTSREISAQRFDGDGDGQFTPTGGCSQSLGLQPDLWQLFALTCDPAEGKRCWPVV